MRRRNLLALPALGWAAGMARASGETLSPPRTPGIPVPPGQIERALGGLDAIANSILARSGVPGLAIAVVQDGRTVYARGFGVKLLGEGAAIDAETVFPLASVSKPIGATVIAAQGDTVDSLCWHYYGRTAGVTESVQMVRYAVADAGTWIRDHVERISRRRAAVESRRTLPTTRPQTETN